MYKSSFIKKTIAASVLVTSAYSVASADLSKGGIFLEPSVTYTSGEMKTSYPIFNDSTEKTTGLGLGLRLGAHVHESIFLGADVRYSMLSLDSSALNGKADANALNYGVTLGAQTPVAGLRVWGTYIIGGELDPKEINSVDAKFKEQTGYRVGVGFYVAVVSLNLEYQDTKFNKLESESGITGTTDSITGEDKAWIASVSFPVSF
ncbi:MAG: outer membrane beta-barrel protein [Bdellovibrio sp.]|nr:outer membrane beta-barrel protein [Bdellovibrio sp.]